MNRYTKIFIFLIFGGCFFSSNLKAQTIDSATTPQVDTSIYIIKTNDGKSIIGKIIEENPRETTLKLEDGRTVILPSYIIESRKKVTKENMVNGKIYSPNPHPSRYFYSPTAIPMNKGEFYIQSIYFLTAQLQYGITDNWSLGIATTVAAIPMLISTKYSYKIKDNHHVAIGGQIGNLTYAAPKTYLGIGFGCYTYRTAESNITLAGGYAFTSTYNEELIGMKPNAQGGYDPIWDFQRRNTYSPALSFSGVRRMSKNIALMGEFWYLPETKYFFGGPFIRMFFNKTSTYDIGIVGLSIGEDGTFLIPTFSYTYKFNQ